MLEIIIGTAIPVTLFAIVYNILENVHNKQKYKVWKELATSQEEALQHLKKENALQRDVIDSYKELCKTNDIIINCQKEHIKELVDILKIEKP